MSPTRLPGEEAPEQTQDLPQRSYVSEEATRSCDLDLEKRPDKAPTGGNSGRKWKHVSVYVDKTNSQVSPLGLAACCCSLQKTVKVLLRVAA